MAATTSKGIQYPTSGDNITPLETHFANLAESADAAIGDAILVQGIPAGGTDGQILAKDSDSDYDTTWIDNYTSQVKHLVKAGEAMSKGQPVYVSSANGTNMIVSLASNTTEAKSSKTFGLIAQDLLLNDQGFVVTEGLLAGLDTSAANAVGDPVWLGANGALVYGTPPTSPAHLVYIGVVTRKQNNNGEIFIKVQNGYELGELHDVLLEANASIADNEVLAFDTTSQLWKNQTSDEANLVDKSTNQTIAGNKTFSSTMKVASATGRGFSVDPTSGSIEMGRTDGVGVTPYVDFHTGSNSDYNARIIASGSDLTLDTPSGWVFSNNRIVGRNAVTASVGSGEALAVASTSTGTNSFIGFYRAGSGSRTGYVGHASTTNNGIYINCDDATGANLAVGTDGTARIWSTDIYNRTYSTNPTVCVTTAGTLGRITSATKYKLEIEPKEVTGSVVDLEPKTWLDKALFEKQQRFMAAVEAGEDTSEWVGYTTDWVQPRVAGLIAEDLIEAGLEDYVFYGEPDEGGNREVEGIQYDRLWIELLPIVRQQKEQIASLEARLTALENK